MLALGKFHQVTSSRFVVSDYEGLVFVYIIYASGRNRLNFHDRSFEDVSDQ